MKILKAAWEVVLKNLIAASLLANFISFVFFFFLFRIGDDLVRVKDLPLSFTEKIKSQKLENILDSISYASQLGRLDTVSLLLAIFAIILGFGAVVGFLHIKETSNVIARNEAEKWLDDYGPKEVTKWLEKHPDVVREAIQKLGDVESGNPSKIDTNWSPEEGEK